MTDIAQCYSFVGQVDPKVVQRKTPILLSSVLYTLSERRKRGKSKKVIRNNPWECRATICMRRKQ